MVFLEELVVTKACETSLIEIYLQSLSIKILEVMANCQQIKRDGQNGTWITNDMIEAYCNLRLGIAKSVEVWQMMAKS
jgi:leucyl/phenylalanyl-tRNA--protein transferase